jgi:predicted HNH restriction endonuclease
MRQLKSFDFGPPRGRPQKYPWDKWEDGSIWQIVRGNDYAVSTENMQVNLHTRAAKDGRKVQTRKVETPEGEGLVFQFLPGP